MTIDFNFQQELTDDFTVERKSSTPDGMGGFDSSFVTVGTIKGRLDDERFNENPRARQDVAFITHRLFTFPGEDIKREDRITGVGRVLRVIYLATVHENHPLEVLCEEIDP